MKRNTQQGYAILFTVVIVSVISVIAIGLSNTTYKQLILSSVAKDSQVAFYESDTAVECALYADLADTGLTGLSSSGAPFQCGVNAVGQPVTISILNSGNGYDMFDTLRDQSDYGPCFDAHITKTTSPVVGQNDSTSISARGYNTCNKSDPRAVEREIEVNY